MLLLDVMGTLVHDPFHDSVGALFGLSLDAYFAVKSKPAYLDFECGRIDAATYAERLFTDGRPVDLDALEAWYRRHYAWLEGMRALVAELHAAGVVMHALSNCGAFWRWIDEELDVGTFVPFTFVSARTGLRKPDPAAYLHACEALQVTPEDCLFVDDREKNCAGARRVGMRAALFTDADTLRRDLRTAGLPV